jgi:putative chitinase
MIAYTAQRLGVGILTAAGATAALLTAPSAQATTDHAPGSRTSTQAAVVDFTRADLEAMFPGRVGDPGIVDEGLPTLNQAMVDAGITTPYRQAAFLATIAHESIFEYSIREIGDTRPYGGRGYIQLTGDFNYGPAGDYFGIDLLGNPDLALSLEWSAPIARWYWTVARDINPMADALDMGAVNAAIGYPAGEEDNRRCDSFKSALQYLTGSIPDGINCVRPAAYRGDTRDLSRQEWEAHGDWR